MDDPEAEQLIRHDETATNNGFGPNTSTRLERPRRTSAAMTSLPRELEERHVFCITISAVVGMGFFVRAGTVEAIGGSGAVIVASLLLGCVASSVAQDIARMLRLWSIRNAHVSFIRAFVDDETAIIAGWLYFVAHSCCFAVLTATVEDMTAHLWNHDGHSMVVSIPAVLIPVLTNLMPIRYSKKILLVLFFAKFFIAGSLLVIMISINPMVAHSHRNREEKREVVFHHTGPYGIPGALGVAVFALCSEFVGIESIAILAMEAVVEQSHPVRKALEADDLASMEDGQPVQEAEGLSNKDLFSRPAMLVPVLTTTLYILLGWIVMENISWTDERLPTLDGRSNASHSVFILSARDYSETLGNIVAFLMIVIAVSTSTTTLLLASRSLFGMALIHSGYPDATVGASCRSAFIKRMFLFLSRKSKFNVPWVAVLLPSLAPGLLSFIWFIWPDAIGPVRTIGPAHSCS
jgi:amino acid permease